MEPFDDMNLLQRQNLARAHFLELATRNILGESEMDEDIEEKHPHLRRFEKRDEAVNLSHLRRIIKRQSQVLRSIVSYLTPMDITFSLDQEKFQMYNTLNYREIGQAAAQALTYYEDMQEQIKVFLESAEKTQQLSRNPTEWTKSVKEYLKVQEVQKTLNDIIEPLSPEDAPGLKPKPKLRKEIDQLDKSYKKLKQTFDEDLEIVEALEDDINEKEREFNDPLISEERKKELGEILDRLETLHLIKDGLLRKKDTQLQEIIYNIRLKEDELKVLSGQARLGGAKPLTFGEFEYGRLHYAPTMKFKAKVIFEALDLLKFEAQETDKMFEDLTTDIYSGTQAVLRGSARSDGDDFVERKFR